MTSNCRNRSGSRLLPVLSLVAVATASMPISSISAQYLPPTATEIATPVVLNFKGVVGSESFDCAVSWKNIGTSRANVRVADFRMYVHGIELIDANGNTTKVEMDKSEPWQDGSVALLDFENATGACSNGTPETRNTITGTAPESAVKNASGVRLVMGVPFEMNHRELASQSSTLSLTRLFWSWNAGHKFLRVDMRATPADNASATPKAWVIHLGSTGCSPSGGASVVPTECSNSNRPLITLKDLNPTRDTILVDLAALLADSDLLNNTAETAAGCMAASSDPDCGPLFGRLGLDHPNAPAGAQQKFMRVQRTSTASAAERTKH